MGAGFLAALSGAGAVGAAPAGISPGIGTIDPEPAALQLELRGVTLHYPNGLTSKQFNQLIDYSTVLGTGAFPTH